MENAWLDLVTRVIAKEHVETGAVIFLLFSTQIAWKAALGLG